MYYSHGMFAHHKIVLTLYSYTRIYLYVTASCRLNRLFKAKLVQSRQCPSVRALVSGRPVGYAARIK